MNKKSIWLDKRKKQIENPLKEDIKTDILIIGGGIAGITTAYFLKDCKKNITIIDQNICGNGMTGHTTGKITFLQGDYSTIETIRNSKESFLYYQSQKEAIKILKEIIEKEKIDCDLEKVPSFLFAQDKKQQKKLEKEKQFLKKYNIPYQEIKYLPNHISTSAIKVDNTYVFNPIKYLDALIKILKKHNISIYENTRAIKIQKNQVITEHSIITAKEIIVTTHYPFFILDGKIPFKTTIENSYILASKNKNLKFQAITSKNPTLSYRYYKDYFLLAGNSHKPAESLNYKKKYQELEQEYHTLFKSPILYEWHAHDIISSDYLPIIGKLKDHLFLSTAFQKWGMTNGTIAGKIISDIILNKENKYIPLFNPYRSFTTLQIGVLINYSYSTMKSYIKSRLFSPESFTSNEQIKISSNKKTGIVITPDKKVHKISLICPHMKCHLIFNSFDNTWDCPCHGSRFDIDGNIITGPSTKSIKKEN